MKTFKEFVTESQDVKSNIMKALAPIMKEYGVKASYSVGRGGLSTMIKITLQSGVIDFNARDGETINSTGRYKDYKDNPKAKEFQKKVDDAIKKAGGWYDNSDSQRDYFDTAFYYNVDVGKYDKPYVLTKKD